MATTIHSPNHPPFLIHSTSSNRDNLCLIVLLPIHYNLSFPQIDREIDTALIRLVQCLAPESGAYDSVIDCGPFRSTCYIITRQHPPTRQNAPDIQASREGFNTHPKKCKALTAGLGHHKGHAFADPADCSNLESRISRLRNPYPIIIDDHTQKLYLGVPNAI